ncbi:MAG: hypothetical protein JXA57_06045, partial [Armatimonadetes bacterium]|nr:hypothetical protein [Armatimonadota bacterium]
EPIMSIQAAPGSGSHDHSEDRELTPRERALQRQEEERMSGWQEAERVAEAPFLGAGSYLSKLLGNVGYAFAQAPPIGPMGQPTPSYANWVVNYPEVEQNAQAVRQLGDDTAQAISDFAVGRSPDTPVAAALAGGGFAGGEEATDYLVSRGLGKVKTAVLPVSGPLAKAGTDALWTVGTDVALKGKTDLGELATGAAVSAGTGAALDAAAPHLPRYAKPDQFPGWLFKAAGKKAVKDLIITAADAAHALGVRSLKDAHRERRRALLATVAPNKYVGLMVDGGAPLNMIQGDLLRAGVSPEFTGRLMESARRRRERQDAQRARGAAAAAMAAGS